MEKTCYAILRSKDLCRNIITTSIYADYKSAEKAMKKQSNIEDDYYIRPIHFK